MKRPALLTLLAVAALGIGLAGSVAAKTTPSSAVQVQATEFRYGLSRGAVKPGKLRIELVNYGEDVHDLAIRRVGGTSVRNLGHTLPGERSVDRFRVRRGAYMLWCTISDHRARGMRATLKVRK